jgi:hypothetical protein
MLFQNLINTYIIKKKTDIYQIMYTKQYVADNELVQTMQVFDLNYYLICCESFFYRFNK